MVGVVLVSSVHAASNAPVRPSGTVQKTSTYVPVQPVPPAGVEREPRAFGPMFGTPATLTAADMLVVRPNTRFLQGEGAAEPRGTETEGGPPASETRADEPARSEQADRPGRSDAKGPDGAPLSAEDAKRVEQMQKRDQEVRAHEQAHKAAAGRYAGAMSLQLERGPDGRMYATSGEVDIDTAPVEGDPEATIRKMQQIQRAARAPAEPSAADRRVAAKAAAEAQKARAELRTFDRLM